MVSVIIIVVAIQYDLHSFDYGALCVSNTATITNTLSCGEFVKRLELSIVETAKSG